MAAIKLMVDTNKQDLVQLKAEFERLKTMAMFPVRNFFRLQVVGYGDPK
nr:hypothetical protein [Paraflavitalea speifideiaquila]